MSRGIIINNPGSIETVINITTVNALDGDSIYAGSVWLSNISSDEISAVKTAIEAYSPGGGGDDRYDEGYAAGTNDAKHAIAVDHQPIAEEYQTLLPGVADIQAQDPTNLIGQRNIFNLAADYLSEGGGEWHSSNPLCFTAEQANSTVKSANNRLVKPEISYDGVNWDTYTEGTKIRLTNIGDKVYFRSKFITYINNSAFSMSGKISASGNPESLIESNNGEIYPICYSYMFYGCTSLTTAPELPATTLVSNCYYYMFYGCTSLTTAPELPATTLASSCYSYMFYGCTSLTTAPELPATTLASSCYSYMFQNCSKLTTAPELPATTLASSCYQSMFRGCTSLTTVPELPATTLAISCYSYMLYGCTSLTTAPELPATTLANYCYQSMFQNCSKLNYIKVGAAAWSDQTNWVNGVSSTGTFVKPTATSIATGTSGIPSGWVVENY